jgi:hypothetical protein
MSFTAKKLKNSGDLLGSGDDFHNLSY